MKHGSPEIGAVHSSGKSLALSPPPVRVDPRPCPCLGSRNSTSRRRLAHSDAAPSQGQTASISRENSPSTRARSRCRCGCAPRADIGSASPHKGKFCIAPKTAESQSPCPRSNRWSPIRSVPVSMVRQVPDQTSRFHTPLPRRNERRLPRSAVITRSSPTTRLIQAGLRADMSTGPHWDAHQFGRGLSARTAPSSSRQVARPPVIRLLIKIQRSGGRFLQSGPAGFRSGYPGPWG